MARRSSPTPPSATGRSPSSGRCAEHAYTPKEIKALKETAERAEDAPPVIRKIHKKGITADSLRGLFEVTLGGRPAVVEYKPDPELRDSEQIPFLECPACHAPGYLPTAEDQRATIEAFLRREVLPYTPDAWYVPESVKIGYKINADIQALEKETEGLLSEIIGGRI